MPAGKYRIRQNLYDHIEGTNIWPYLGTVEVDFVLPSEDPILVDVTR